MRPSSGRGRAVAAALCFGGLMSGCALPIQAEVDRASDIARYATQRAHAAGPQANLLDRALAGCDEKVQKAETACVKAAVAGLSTRSLAALVPGCRTGRVCHYEQVTRDRLGFVAATSTDFIRRWRVDIDLRAFPADAAHAPITVIDRDDFDRAGAVRG